MKDQTSASDDTEHLRPYLSPPAVWALSVGSAIGWGSLVVTSSLHDVFERADARMYEEKKLLKNMGALSREDAET